MARTRSRPTALSHPSDSELPTLPSAMSDDGAHDSLHEVLSRAGVGIVHRDGQGRVLVANQAFCDLVGRSKEEMDGQPFDAFTHPDDIERSRGIYAVQLEKVEPFEIEKRYVRPDGHAVWCSVHVSFVIDSDGRPQSTILVASDIAARKAAEAELRESEEHYRYSVELSPQITWTAAPDGAILDISPRWHATTGIDRESSIGENWVTSLHPDDLEEARARWHAARVNKQPMDVEYRLRMDDGRFHWFRARAAARLDAAGNIIRWYGTLEDVNDRRIAQDALRDSEARFRLAAEATGLGIWDYDALTDQRQWSSEFKAMLGFSKDITPTIASALARVIPEDRHLLQALIDAAHAGNSNTRFDVTLRICRTDTGEERWMRTDGWRMHESSGRLARVLVTIRDVTEERTTADVTRHAATHDGLTGLPNRAYFTKQLESAIQLATPDQQLGLVLFDVDRLKEVNDTIGHDAGDALLRTFGARLRDAFQSPAVLGRLGGDEFAVLLHDVDREGLRTRIITALDSLGKPFEYEAYAPDTQATAGAAMFPVDGRGATDLLKAADIALYAGKNGERGTLSMFEPSMRAGLQRRASMLSLARAALRDDRVVPHYQSKIRLADRKIVGFEALLRWRHDDFGMQPPATIVAAFEDTHLAIALGDAMFAQVAQDVRGWLDKGLVPGRVAINLSPAEFRHDHLIARVCEPFNRLNLPLDMLELEITETVLLGRDTEKIAAILAAFRRQGVTIALDDFGTGYASLTHLKAFPVDVIKIDRGFVSNVCEGLDDAAIVDAIIGLANRLDLDVVAEGIESEAQVAYLQDQGCAFGQGYLFGRAVPASAVDDLLAAP